MIQPHLLAVKLSINSNMTMPRYEKATLGLTNGSHVLTPIDRLRIIAMQHN